VKELVKGAMGLEDISESKFQKKVIKWLRKHGFYCYHIWNGANVSQNERFNAIAEGVISGVADIEVMLKNGRSAKVELKIKGGSQRKGQKIFEAVCDANDHNYFLLYPEKDPAVWRDLINQLKEIEAR